MKAAVLGTAAFFSLGLTSSPAHAWYKHQPLMSWLLRGIPPQNQEVHDLMQKQFPAPCPKEDEEHYSKLSSDLDLQLNPKNGVTPTNPDACLRKGTMTPSELLLGAWIDEPDHGMDQDLEDWVDLRNDRRYFGAPGNQAFRHNYFAGWVWKHPLRTIQIPPRTIGQAPDRFERIATKARALLKAGDMLWGLRVLSWSMHYIQDLSQPFHTVQVLNWSMTPLSALMVWPPTQSFQNLLNESNRIHMNYHYAYEGYVLGRISEGDHNPYADCLANPEKHVNLLRWNPSQGTPLRELAEEVARRSVGLTNRLGSSVIAYFGEELQGPDFDLPKKKGSIDYAKLAAASDKDEARARLDKVTCEAMANGMLASRKALEWALRP